jgi:hypothetical protein
MSERKRAHLSTASARRARSAACVALGLLVLSSCQTEGQPVQVRTNDQEIEDARLALDALESKYEVLESELSRLDTENWRNALPSVRKAVEESQEPISELRAHLDAYTPEPEPDPPSDPRG